MHAEMSREIERLTHQCEETEALVNEKFKDELNLLVVEKRSLEELCDEQKLQITSLEKKVCDSERKEQDSQHLENKYKKLRKKLEETEKELEGTKLRLVYILCLSVFLIRNIDFETSYFRLVYPHRSFV